ncbi:transcription factor TFIIIB component B'' homolog [Watersipora subatra]|uniref:transcription factor TFIIIB component B'' homolog n=1 Tax=Watersipora subatra TaxID=2589382 RepID=UPI00355BEA9C
MSGRRSRIAARPNLGRPSRVASREENAAKEVTQASEKDPQPQTSEVIPTLPNAKEQVKVIDATDKPTSTPSPDSPDGQRSLNTPDGGSGEKPAEKKEQAKAIGAADQPNTAPPDAEPLSNTPDDGSSEKPAESRRRAKIQLKPMLSRRPRTGSTPSAPTAGTRATDEAVPAATENLESAAISPSTLTPTPASENPASLPALAEGTSMAAPEHPMVSPKHFRSKAKPNVVEAGKARMRRLSESLDLSSHHSGPRKRHISTSGEDNLSQSTVRVEPITDPDSGKVFHNAQQKAKQRQESKQISKDAIDREVMEEEHAEMTAEVAPKPKRKVRRLIKSSEAPDTAKMTIQELIYYQPTSNPLPVREIKKYNKPVEKEVEKEPAEPAPEPEVDMAPQLMIGEDGQVIINQQSLTVQQTPQETVTYEDVTVDRDGEGATYASFRPNSCNTKLWSERETEQFYKALAAIGTDFSLMCQLFPKRSRAELKKKFKKEERTHLAKVQRAMHGELQFDAEPFPELEKEEVKKPEKKDQRKSRGGLKVRTYYDVPDKNEFRRDMESKRRNGTRKKNKLPSTPEAAKANNDADNISSPGHLLSLNTTSELNREPTASTSKCSSPSRDTILLKTPTASVTTPIPSISTILDRSSTVDNRIISSLMAKQKPLHVQSHAKKNTPGRSSVMLSPLYNLENGDSIMMSSKHIPGTDKKVHHLYLFSPPKTSSHVNVDASPNTPAVPATHQAGCQDGTIRVTPVASTPAILPRLEQSTGSPAGKNQQSPIHLTQLLTPRSIQGQSDQASIEQNSASHSLADPLGSQALGMSGQKVPTKKLGWVSYLDEFGVETERRELAFTSL